MVAVLKTEEFSKWVDELRDLQAKDIKLAKQLARNLEE
jgi:putative component of toxin-antitoxin plasmid stabilization module